MSCYIDYNISMAAENLWKVDIVNTHMTGSDRWHAINSQVRPNEAKVNHCIQGWAEKGSPGLVNFFLQLPTT